MRVGPLLAWDHSDIPQYVKPRATPVAVLALDSETSAIAAFRVGRSDSRYGADPPAQVETEDAILVGHRTAEQRSIGSSSKSW
jgi:hypothetical protein